MLVFNTEEKDFGEFKVTARVNNINFINGIFNYLLVKQTLDFSGKKKFPTLSNLLFKNINQLKRLYE